MSQLQVDKQCQTSRRNNDPGVISVFWGSQVFARGGHADDGDLSTKSDLSLLFGLALLLSHLPLS